ncbi:putative quinol monooxygenase [Neobacillus niacini]|uniref:putative quinol monooxygenase n=1 Tax=Neobacillus niacini TaxID=86668 RepID=UPI001F1C1855|nr:putative quinol monooxygenase [Neobacillus niacini]
MCKIECEVVIVVQINGMKEMRINPTRGVNEMIKVVAKAKLKPGVSVEDYLIQAKELVAETRKEEGCITYALHQDINDSSIVTMLEEWVDEESLNQHNQTEHVKRIVPGLRELRESSEINIYREVE